MDCKGMRIASFISLEVMNRMNGGLFIKKKYSHVELSKWASCPAWTDCSAPEVNGHFAFTFIS